MNPNLGRVLFVVGAVGALAASQPAVGLIVGVALALLLGNPFPKQTKALAMWVLQVSVVLLGFHMDLFAVLRAGLDGALAALVGITLALILGRALGRLLAVPSTTSWLLSVGTAICGGSAIAACAPVLGAKDEEMSAAAGTVFLLNGIALFTFPPLGHAMGLDDHQFGMLAALAIHDTSSVVGAASTWSPDALRLATTVKLARALFILPLPFLLTWLSRAEGQGAAKKPWFVLFFLAAAALATFVPAVHAVGDELSLLGNHGLSLALFFVGAGLTRKTLAAVGGRPFAQGVLLWLIVITGTLLAVRFGFV